MPNTLDWTPTRPIFYRDTDGLLFDPDVRPGYVRCRACVALLSASGEAIAQHDCPALSQSLGTESKTGGAAPCC